MSWVQQTCKVDDLSSCLDYMSAAFCSCFAVCFFHWGFCWGSFRSYVAHMLVQMLREALRAFSSISLRALTQRYVCPPTGQRGQSAHYKQLWMKYEAFLITLGSSEGVILLAAADDVRGERRLTNSRQQRTTRWPSLLRFSPLPQSISGIWSASIIRSTWRCWVFTTHVCNTSTPQCFETSLVLYLFYPHDKTFSLDVRLSEVQTKSLSN